MMSGVSAFLWQAALLLLGAYFLGAFVGCWLRRRFSPPPKVAMESDATSRAASFASVGGADRFGRALEGNEQVDTLQSAASSATLRQPANTDPVASPQASGRQSAVEATAGPLGDAAARTATPPVPPPLQTPATQVVPATPPPPVSIPPEEPPVSVAPIVPDTPPEPATPVAPPEPVASVIPETSIAPPPSQPIQLTPPMSAAAAAAAALAAHQAATAQQKPPAVEPPSTAADAATDNDTLPTSTSVKNQMESLTPPVGASVAGPALALDLPASSGSAGQSTVAAQIEPAAASVSAAADDLTLIDGITTDDSTVLHTAGVTTFASIAGWSAQDVNQINGRISGDRRIARENWIEQAQLLMQNGSTAYTRRVQAALTPRPAETSPAPFAQPVPPRAALVPAEAPVATAMIEIPPVAAPKPLAPPAAPAVENVPSEPSAIAAVADITAAAAAIAAVVTISGAAPPTPAAGAATVDPKPDVAQRAAFSRERRGYTDDLQQIDGINSEVEKLLHQQGVTRIGQIAGWTIDEQQRIDRLLGGMNRVHREDWVAQAARIHGLTKTGSETQIPGLRLDMPSDDIQLSDSSAVAGPVILTDAVTAEPSAPATPAETGPADQALGHPPEPVSSVASIARTPDATRSDISDLRSVRSEALIGAKSIDSASAVDDLKRIRGIGVLIEKRLVAMGYSNYTQIGSWTQSDVDRVNQQLDFRGRIERENWIEQARILSAGGQTEFSRRQEPED